MVMSIKPNYKTFSLKPEVIEKLRDISAKECRSMSGQIAYWVEKNHDW